MKTVVIHSGGLDSTVLLYREVKMEGPENVLALSFDYGQRHRVELEFAEWHQTSLAVRHARMDLSDLKTLMKGSSQIDAGVAVPEGHYSEENMKQTIVPNRNMIMLSIATAWALSEGATVVSYAAHSGDHTIYPDCRVDFVEALRKAIWLADWKKVHLTTPYAYVPKYKIVKEGLAMGVPFEKTWSCYQGGGQGWGHQPNSNKEPFKACGRCGTCVERLEAFDLAKATDPLQYIDREFYREVIIERARKAEERE